MKIGQLKTDKSIGAAINEINYWLNKINVPGLNINTNYDSNMNIALLRFNYKGNNYEFRSSSQKNARLNMWGIARVMEYKVRAQIMGIEDFTKSMTAYLQIEDKSFSPNPHLSKIENQSNYTILGINPNASNEEIKARYRELTKTFHPDMANSEEAKREFSRRFSEINAAYTQVKKERNII